MLRNGWRFFLAALAVLIALVVCLTSLRASAVPSARDQLIGTWRLVSAGDVRPDGSLEPFPEYGPHAIGYLMYGSTGHMCVYLASPVHPKWKDLAKPTDAEKLRSYDANFSYCGTFEVREREGSLIHRPEMASWPHYVKSDERRDFRLMKDSLILSGSETAPGQKESPYRITWQRVR
jgi:hypothetical protein